VFQCLFAFLNDVLLFSITFMASSKASLVHLVLVLTTLHLLTFLFFILLILIQEMEHFPCPMLASLLFVGRQIYGSIAHFTSFKAHSTPLCFRSPWS
jgi:hypothetical protein